MKVKKSSECINSTIMLNKEVVQNNFCMFLELNFNILISGYLFLKSFITMSTHTLVCRHNTAKLHGQHHCNHCGKNIPTAAGLKLHITNSKNVGCHEQWDLEVLQRDSKSPSPPVCRADIYSPQEPESQSKIPMVEFSPEISTFVPPERQPTPLIPAHHS